MRDPTCFMCILGALDFWKLPYKESLEVIVGVRVARA